MGGGGSGYNFFEVLTLTQPTPSPRFVSPPTPSHQTPKPNQTQIATTYISPSTAPLPSSASRAEASNLPKLPNYTTARHGSFFFTDPRSRERKEVRNLVGVVMAAASLIKAPVGQNPARMGAGRSSAGGGVVRCSLQGAVVGGRAEWQSSCAVLSSKVAALGRRPARRGAKLR